MLSGHHYWNLEAYQETQDLVGHYAQFPASKFVATDGDLIPNGQLSDVTGTPMDFRKANSIGRGINGTTSGEFCGTGGCNGIFDPEVPIPRKKDQGGASKVYDDHSCVVIESESLIDAINNPEFGVDQIYGPQRPYNWEATYVFSTLT
ncbi:hypothetical protein C0991_012052 [Blastosporella zonata]|nr:hypothetical protein C0991_012052 [Blastosporella zonata]